MGLEPRLRARPVRRFGHQHADAAGGDRDARQRRPRGRLFGLLSVRRRRADPVPLLRVHDPQAEDRRAAGRRHGDARDRAAQPGALRQDAGRGDERPAAGRCKIVALRTGAPEPAGRARARRRRERRRARRRPDQGRARAGAQAPRRGGARPRAQGPQRPRLPARVRLAAERRRPGDRRSRAAGREGRRHRPGPPRRRRHPAAPRPRARVRRSRRPARPSRRLRGDAQVLRRLDQGHRRVQLHLDRPRHGARLPGRRDPDPAARHRQALDRPGRAC